MLSPRISQGLQTTFQALKGIWTTSYDSQIGAWYFEEDEIEVEFDNSIRTQGRVFTVSLVVCLLSKQIAQLGYKFFKRDAILQWGNSPVVKAALLGATVMASINLVTLLYHKAKVSPKGHQD